MPTCPNCGGIVMNGDPYCSNCGTTFRWVDDEKNSTDDGLSTFKHYLIIAKGAYVDENYSSAFLFLSAALSDYDALDDSEKRQSTHPLDKSWVIDFLCKAFNTHNPEYIERVNKIITENEIIVNICMDCSLIYPTDSTYCIKCGKFLEKPYHHRIPSKVSEDIDHILKHKFVNEHGRILLKLKSLELMESNDCYLDEIRDDFGDTLIFIFKKEHEYFDTVYECVFEPKSARFDRVFYDVGYYSNHDRLLQNPSFKKLVKNTEQKTGYTFLSCGGGYENVIFDDVTGDMMFTDKIRVFVRFRIDDKKIAVYNLDLDRMELTDERIYYD